MASMLRLDYVPTAACWCQRRGAPVGRVALAALDSPLVRLYATEGPGDLSAPVATVSLHRSPVVVLELHEQAGVVVSGDQKGVLEYWNAAPEGPDEAHTLPAGAVAFRFKVDTDLFDLAKAKAAPCGLSFSPDGRRFAVTATDKQLRVFDFARGKLVRKYDESMAVVEDARARGALKLDSIDFGQRAARERELEAAEGAGGLASCNPVFDQSGHFVAFTTLLGIKVLNIDTHGVARVLGRVENQERFLALALYQGTPKVDSQMMQSRMGDKPKTREEMDETRGDPLFVATAFKKSRFYLFSGREPALEDGDGGAGRDVFNERPTAEQLVMETVPTALLGKDAVLRTSMGDIHIKLYAAECPKTVENFTVHARNGYYDGVVFHRVIPGFMIRACTPHSPPPPKLSLCPESPTAVPPARPGVRNGRPAWGRHGW